MDEPELSGGWSRSILDFLRLPESERHIGNISARFLLCPEEKIPLSLGQTERTDQAFMASLSSCLGAYGTTRTKHAANAWQAAALHALSRSAERVLQWIDADTCAILFNLPFGTVLLPKASPDDVLRYADRVTARYDLPVVIRGLNETYHADILAGLRGAGFVTIPWRRVFIAADPANAMARHRPLQQDLRLLRRHPSLIVTRSDRMDEDDLVAALAMYRRLYIDKYSTMNAEYSLAFLRSCATTGALRFITIRSAEGKLLAFGTYYTNHSTVTIPLIGYDWDLFDTIPFYRLLTAEFFKLARDLKRGFHMSGGAGTFKMNRGGVPSSEYLAVKPRSLAAAAVFRTFSTVGRGLYGSRHLAEMVNRL